MNWPDYPDYVQSGFPWLGALPSHWNIPHLGHITECLDSIRIPLNASDRAEVPGDIPYWGANGVVGSVDRPLVDGELVLLGEDGAPFNERDKDKAFFVDEPIWPNNHVHVLRASPRILPRFLTHALNATEYSLFIEGATREKLTQGTMRSIPIAVPPATEQHAIVRYLDRETAKIDALVDKQEQLIATLREDRAATVTHAVTKGLDPNAPLRETGTKWVDTIPENWTLSRFSRHISINSGQVDPRLEPYRDMTLIAPNHVESKTGKLLEAESAEEQGADSGKYLVSAGQVIYSKIRPNLAKVTIAPVDCLCSADMYGLSTDPNELFSEFLLYELLSQPFTDYVIDSSMRVAMPKVNHDSLGAAPIWFPPIEEQYKVVEFLDARCASIDALIDKSTEMIETLREYRSALITNAVTGKIDVREAV